MTDTKREAVLKAALKLFNEKSFAGTPVPEIAKLAGVATGTIYHHWKSKEELVNDLYRTCKRDLMGMIMVEPNTSARNEVLAWWRNALRFAFEHREAFQFLETHHHQPYLDEETVAFQTEIHDAAMARMQQWQERGEIVDLNPMTLLALMWGALIGYHKQCVAEGFTPTADQIHATGERVWMIFAPTPSPE